MSLVPNIPISDVFNPSIFRSTSIIDTSAVPVYVLAITPGIAASSKALVLNGSGNVAGINSLSASQLTGTLQTAAQPNITSVGTLTNLTLNSGGTGLDIPSLKFSGTTFNQTYYLNITAGSATASQALVLNASKDISGINSLSGSTINGTTLVSGTSANFGSLSIGSTSVINTTRDILNVATITSTDTIKCNRATNGQSFSSINGSSTCALYHFTNGVPYFGTTTPNDLVLQTSNVERMRISGSTGNITCSGTIYATNLLGFIGYANQSAITTVGTLTELGVGTTYPSTEYLLIAGSGSSYLNGSYTRIARFVGSNITPVQMVIEVHNGSSGTSTNPGFIGMLTANDLRFGSSGSTLMTMTSAGRLGVGTTTPTSFLQVVGTVSNTFNSGGQLYAAGTSGSYTAMQLGPVSVSTCANFSGPIQCTSIYCTSDRRCKEEIEVLDPSYCDRFYELPVYQYRYKHSEETIPKIGFISQDLNKAGYLNLLSLSPNESLKAENDGDIEGAQMNIDYTKITALNAMMIKKLIDRIEVLEQKLSST